MMDADKRLPDDVIERAARAVFDADDRFDGEWQDASEYAHAYFRDVARAALLAARDAEAGRRWEPDGYTVEDWEDYCQDWASIGHNATEYGAEAGGVLNVTEWKRGRTFKVRLVEGDDHLEAEEIDAALRADTARAGEAGNG
jgi:hypothetical protein